MRRVAIKMTAGIFLVAMGAASTALTAVYGYYWLAAIALLATIALSVKLSKYSMRPYKDVKRLMNAIRFSEFNVSFVRASGKGLGKELADQMERSVKVFNDKIHKRENERAFYELLLNRIDFAVLVTSEREDVKWINRKALDLLGSPGPKRISSLRNVSLPLVESIGRIRPGEVRMIELHDGANGKIALSVVEAIIGKEEVEIFSVKEIQPVIDETENVAWGKMVQVLTHEIMNSITPIISLSRTFSSPDMEYDLEMIKKAVETIHRRSSGLIEFVNNYKRLSNTSLPNPVLFPAWKMVEDVERLLKAQDIVFSHRIIPQDINIYADRGHMEQILINLIRNSHEAGAGKSDVRVNVGIEGDEYGRPVITVSDNGPGILPEVMNKIFVPFFSTKTTGSGLGLSICRQLINSNGGSVNVVSRQGEGTQVMIRMNRISHD